jgi:hypothetical protein
VSSGKLQQEKEDDDDGIRNRMDQQNKRKTNRRNKDWILHWQPQHVCVWKEISEEAIKQGQIKNWKLSSTHTHTNKQEKEWSKRWEENKKKEAYESTTTARGEEYKEKRMRRKGGEGGKWKSNEPQNTFF